MTSAHIRYKQLVDVGKKSLFRRLFEASVRYSPVRIASEILRGQKMSDKLKAMFGACQVSSAIAPRLQVREKK